jgi:hypothetical protein
MTYRALGRPDIVDGVPIVSMIGVVLAAGDAGTQIAP